MRLVAITDRAHMVPRDVLVAGDFRTITDAFGAAIARVVTRFGAELIVQVREKDLDGGPLLGLVRAAIATGATVWVNDRVDVALAAGASGAQLPERGLTLAMARALAPQVRLGVSCHSIDGVRAAADAGADVIQLGPIWRTPGKGEPLGPLALEGARSVIGTRCELVAVGGIETAERARAAIRAGADAVAAIRAVWSGVLTAR